MQVPIGQLKSENDPEAVWDTTMDFIWRSGQLIRGVLDHIEDAGIEAFPDQRGPSFGLLCYLDIFRVACKAGGAFIPFQPSTPLFGRRFSRPTLVIPVLETLDKRTGEVFCLMISSEEMAGLSINSGWSSSLDKVCVLPEDVGVLLELRDTLEGVLQKFESLSIPSSSTQAA